METNVLHQPRVAFDTARILVDISGADDDLFAWYGDQLAVVLGSSFLRDLAATRDQLMSSQRDDIRSVETGRWRVRLEDELRTRPDVAPSLHELTSSANLRLATR